MSKTDLVNEGTRLHNDTVSMLVRIERDYRAALQSRFQGIVDNWKRYYNQRTDTRILPAEDWRSFTRRPTAFQIVETLVATNTDLVTSADPIVQAEGVGLEDDFSARAIEREVDWALRRNKFNIHFEHMQRAKRVQGISFGKVTWQKQHVITTAPRYTDEAMSAWTDLVKEAERLSQSKAPADPSGIGVQAFDVWRGAVNRTLQGKVVVPEIPTKNPEQRTIFEGPWLERPSVFHLTYDPTIETVQEQDYFFHKIPTKFDDILKRADDNPNSPLPYIKAQVLKIGRAHV